jgi:hypothetical protein
MMRCEAELGPIQCAVVPSSSVIVLGVRPLFLHKVAYAESVGGLTALWFGNVNMMFAKFILQAA